MPTFKAAVLNQIDENVTIRDICIPKLKPGQVLVSVAYSGVCHTQLSEIRGRRGPDPHLPHLLGHEGSGTVLEIGPGVTKVKPDDRVVLTWIKGEGRDVPSTAFMDTDGRTVNCGALATFGELTVASENRLVRLPNTMPLKQAALLGCAVPTGAGIVLRNTIIGIPAAIAIFGLGGVGMSAVLMAACRGHYPIIGIDINDNKLSLAQKMGATHVINAAKDATFVEHIMRLTAGRGVDLAIEAAGKQSAIENAFAVTRKGGGCCVVAGNPTFGTRISLDPFDLIKGKKIIGSFGGETTPDQDIPFFCKMHDDGRLPIDKLISRTFALDEINDAIRAIEEGTVTRAVIENN